MSSPAQAPQLSPMEQMQQQLQTMSGKLRRAFTELGHRTVQISETEENLGQSRSEAQFFRNQLAAAQAKIIELEQKLKNIETAEPPEEPKPETAVSA